MAKSVHILCVDSDPTDREAMRAYADILDWSISFAMTGQAGLQEARDRPFDVIMADANLTDVGGVGLAKMLRETDGANRETPLLLNARDTRAITPGDMDRFAISVVLKKPLMLSDFKSGVLRVLVSSGSVNS